MDTRAIESVPGSGNEIRIQRSEPIKLITALIFFLISAGTVSATDSGVADLTGFWKENCDDPYGLQIMPYGEGLYTVEFCGPGGGGCTREPRGELATPIHGDPQYEVLSEKEIRIWYADAYAPVYLKCTTETHPKLAYSAESMAEARRGQILGLLIHLAYAGFAVLVYMTLRKHLPPANERRVLLIRSGLLALLFAPGPFWSFPFVAPSFALLAVIAQLENALRNDFWLFLGVQFALSAGAILLAWAILLLAIVLMRVLSSRIGKGVT